MSGSAVNGCNRMKFDKDTQRLGDSGGGGGRYGGGLFINREWG